MIFAGNDITSRLCLGTAQFGSNYGIANRKGMISYEEVLSILQTAHDSGIDILDTASLYGSSEELIGNASRELGLNFNVISKLSSAQVSRIGEIRETIKKSIMKLGFSPVYGILVHNFSADTKSKTLLNILINLKKEGIILKTGVSVNSLADIVIILDEKLNIDIVQLPYSVFDRRFEKFFPDLKEIGVEIYARSIFLQGLAFLLPQDLRGNLNGMRKYLKILSDFSSRTGLSRECICLNFALKNTDVSKVVFGVDSDSQLSLNVTASKHLNLTTEIENLWSSLEVDNENLITPQLWQNL